MTVVPQPAATRRPGTRGVDAAEALEDVRELLGRDALTGVGDGELAGRPGDCDRAAGRRVPQRVDQEVVERLAQAARVRDDARADRDPGRKPHATRLRDRPRTRGAVRLQFLVEAMLLSVLGAVVVVGNGSLARGWFPRKGKPSTVTGPDLVTLWRPTGPHELALVEASGWRRWPPRLPDQPIFYPVLNEDYAVRIARDWNVKVSGVGYVTRFDVRREHLEQYEVQQVGGATILEYWIPAEQLEEFNDNIVGQIEVVHTFQ